MTGKTHLTIWDEADKWRPSRCVTTRGFRVPANIATCLRSTSRSAGTPAGMPIDIAKSIDTHAMPGGVKSSFATQHFMDHRLSPEIQAPVANSTRFAGTMPAAKSMIDACIEALVPDAKALKRGQMIGDVGSAAQLCVERWTKLMSV